MDTDYRILENQLKPQLASIDSSLSLIESNIKNEQANFEALLNNGFITRIEALNNLVSNNTAVAIRYYLLVAILMLIELMPVIAKILLPNGSYDEKVRLREELETTLTQNNHKRELDLKEQFNQTAFEQDGQFVQQFFEVSASERKEKMKEQISVWKKENDRSLNDTWTDLKRDMMMKQEE